MNALPIVQTGITTNLTDTSVKINGTVNPNGLAAKAFFTWGKTETSQNPTPVPFKEIGSGTSPVTVSETITDLQPDTTYLYRIIGVNVNNSVFGDYHQFTTRGSVPATKPDAFSITSANAYCKTDEPVGPAVQLNWDPSAGATSYQIYRNGVLYPVDPGMGMKFTNNTNLTIGETYTYKIRAINGSGFTESNEVEVKILEETCGMTTNLVPVIIVNEPDPLELSVGEDYTFKVTASDPEDGDISDNIVYGGSYDPETTIPGTYTKIFTVTDSGGLTVTETLQIILKKNEISTKFSVSDSFQIVGSDFADISQKAAPSEIVDVASHMKEGYGGGKILQNELNGTYVDGENWWYVSLYSKSGRENSIGWLPERIMQSNIKPRAYLSFSSDQVGQKEPVDIDASESYDIDGDDLSYEWDINEDGIYEGMTSTPQITYYWPETGDHWVHVRVRDQYGAYDIASKTIKINWTPLGYDGPKKMSDFLFNEIKGITNKCYCEGGELDSSNISCKRYCESVLFGKSDESTRDRYLRSVLDNYSTYDKKLPKITYADVIATQFTQRAVIDRRLTQNFKSQYLDYWNKMFPSGKDTLREMSAEAADEIMKPFWGAAGYSLDFLNYTELLGGGIFMLKMQTFDTALYNYFSESTEPVGWENICSLLPPPQGLVGLNEGALGWGIEYCKDENFHKAMQELHGIAQQCNDGKVPCSTLDDDKLRNVIDQALERNSLTIIIHSPGELRVFDKNGNMTGLVSGEIKEEIPKSYYDEAGHSVVIFDPSDVDLYRYEVVGIEKPDEKTYGLSVDSVIDGKEAVFNADAIPTTPGEVHQFTVDWQTLAQGGDGVTMKIDKEGDGVFEKTIVSDATLESLTANAGEAYKNTEGAEITFDASLSTDLDGNIVLYEWDFDGDGDYEEHLASPIMTHTYENDYSGKVGLRVTDDKGLTATDTTEVVVSNVAPIVEAGADITSQYSDPVQFGGSFTDPGLLDTHTIKWDFGDGENATGDLVPVHSYAKPGEYTAVLTVTDDDGGIGQDSLKVNVAKEAVTITVENQVGYFSDAAILKATILDDDGQVLSHGPYKANFTVGDKSVGEANIDENGNAEISWVVDSIPTDLSEVKNISVSFGENEYYLAGGGQGSFTVKSAKQSLQDSLEKLRTIKTDNKQAQKEIDKAIGDIENSLGIDFWTDASRLDSKHGQKVFDDGKQAIKSLLKIIEEKGAHDDPAIASELQAVVDGLMKTEVLLTKVAISDAESIWSDNAKSQEKIDSEISKAKEELEKALQELAGGNQDKATDDFKKSWNSAQAAIGSL